ncbi:MAG: hypothetical protein NZ958_05360 [Bacteroidia bacterium]|nr:hypothetical protein [Bacteroidia bacterium]MDW8088989.1 hypothetical protein [Bacteroidia bacterium]
MFRTGLLLGLLLVVISATAGFLYWKLRKSESQRIQLTEEKLELEAEIQSLNEKIKAMEAEINRKDLELAEKSKKVDELSRELAQARMRLRKYEEQGKISAREAEEMRFKLEQMSYYIQEYQGRISKLQEENAQLRARAAELEKQIQQKELQTQQVIQEKERLEIKVKAASYLKATDFRFALVRDNGKEDWDTDFRARRLHRLKICFTVLENEIAEPGERTAYLVISDPNGKVVTNFGKATEGSGYFTVMDTEQPFSAKVTFNYQKARQEVCSLYEKAPDHEWVKGTYQVAVFCEGIEIGRGRFELR